MPKKRNKKAEDQEFVNWYNHNRPGQKESEYYKLIKEIKACIRASDKLLCSWQFGDVSYGKMAEELSAAIVDRLIDKKFVRIAKETEEDIVESYTEEVSQSPRPKRRGLLGD